MNAHKKLNITLCQIHSEVGDIKGNAKKILDFYNSADGDLVIFPELSLTGYNCKDIFLNKDFLLQLQEVLSDLIKHIGEKGLLIGTPTESHNALFNSALLIQNGAIQLQYDKYLLPNYDIFDEKRYFTSGEVHSKAFHFKNHKLRILICEDIWIPPSDYEWCDTTIIINASPFSIDKLEKRLEVTRNYNYSDTTIYLNCVGGQDHLVFDGNSYVLNQYGEFIVHPVPWEEKVISFDTEVIQPITYIKDNNQNIYQAILMSLRDYSKYAQCDQYVLGLSGGIDSAIVATLAVDAFGSDKISCVAMPSEYSPQNSIDDAIKLVNNLGCRFITIPILNIKKAFEQSLIDELGVLYENDIANENLQPRIRNILLMAIANQQNRLLLCTSNKSESAVGYTTIYGDMTGAFAPIIDLYKSQVYEIAKWRNTNIPQAILSHNIVQKYNIIPIEIINKEPSAELKPHQKDSDSLPPYPILDKILQYLIEGIAISDGISVDLIKKIKNMLLISEFKRHQAPPGVKINNTTLNCDRRYPICQKLS